jgi:glutathione S-transferase
MRLLMNKTSPYARIVRIALAEKGYKDVPMEVVDPWSDAGQLLEANPAGRVPALLTDDGRALTESLLIVQWLENQRPQPSLMGADATATIARAGTAMGVIDAAVGTLLGRRIAGAGFDESLVGLKRRRSMIGGLQRLEADYPSFGAQGVPDLACICSVVMIDYVRFRFANLSGMPALPALDGLSAAANGRPSFEGSRPPPV